MTYRKDIDCLRGISVLAVILYHFKFDYFSGGYLGVDIFFVISGFLITSIILEEISLEKFSLINFYERRIRRLFPALIVVIITTSFLFEIVFLETEIKKLVVSIISTILFYANFYFQDIGSYFSPLNEQQPLLHTWSLSIEEQFYLIFPIFLVLFFKKINLAFILIILFALFSISLSQFGGNLKFSYPYVENHLSFFALPQFAFYFTLTRIWEILVGCLLALFLFNNKKNFENRYLVLLGYLLIVLSILFFDRNTLHPSIITLIPITGTLLVLLYSSENFNESGVFVIFNNYILLKIGLISYSLYLWHQPIYQFFNQIYFIDTNNLVKFFIIFLLLILSFFSFKFIEQPFRDKRKISQKNIFIFYILSTILIILFCLYSLYLRDFSKKYSALVYDISNFSKYYENNNFNCSTSAENYISPNNACILGNEQKTELALIGDSHLDIISKELKKELTLLGVSAYQFSYGGCVPSLNLKVYNDKRYICNKYFTEVLNKLKNEPNIKKIVLFSRWSFNLKGERFNNKEGGIEIGSGHYFIPINSDVLVEKKIRQEEILNNIEIFIKKIKNLDKDIYIVMPTPEMGWEVPNNLARILHYKNKIEKNTLSISKKVFDERNSEIYKFFSNLKQNYNLNLIYPNDIFCEDLKCFSHKNNIPLFFDDDHLSIEGSKLLSKKIINHIYSN
jgi:peptidoglycan/LPS O-acetylase OafA/YrhL